MTSATAATWWPGSSGRTAPNRPEATSRPAARRSRAGPIAELDRETTGDRRRRPWMDEPAVGAEDEQRNAGDGHAVRDRMDEQQRPIEPAAERGERGARTVRHFAVERRAGLDSGLVFGRDLGRDIGLHHAVDLGR